MLTELLTSWTKHISQKPSPVTKFRSCVCRASITRYDPYIAEKLVRYLTYTCRKNKSKFIWILHQIQSTILAQIKLGWKHHHLNVLSSMVNYMRKRRVQTLLRGSGLGNSRIWLFASIRIKCSLWFRTLSF